MREQKTSKMFLLRLSLERAASEVKFSEIFSQPKAFFFATFFCCFGQKKVGIIKKISICEAIQTRFVDNYDPLFER